MPKIRPDLLISFGFILAGLGLLIRLFLISQAPQILAPIPPKMIALAPIPIPKIYHFSAQNSAPISDELKAIFSASQAAFLKQLSSDNLVALDLNSHATLLSQGETVLNYPASTTKLMTALVAIDHYQLDQVLEVKAEAFTQGTVVGLKIGEKITVKNLLYGLLIQSGNDAAFVLANNYPGGYPKFVEAMNQKAQDLHLSQTHFDNPSGLDQDNHQTTAWDLAILADEVLKHDLLKEIVSTKTITIGDQSAKIEHLLINTNELLDDQEIFGVKTGTTPLAQEVLITLVKKQNQQILIVVMDSRDRYADTKKIINWIFDQYDFFRVE